MSEKDLEENNENTNSKTPETNQDEQLEPPQSKDTLDSTLQNQKPTEIITVKKSTYRNLIKGIVIAIAAASFFAGYGIGTLDISDTDDDAELNEILAELNAKIDSAQQSAPQPTQQRTQPIAPIIQVSLDDDPVLGNQDAPVTIVEFSDFQCPFCSRFYQQTLPLIEQNYIQTGIVKLVYRDFPLDIHPNAVPAHIAAECADEKGKFWEYHDMLFDKQSEWQGISKASAEEKFSQYASDLGMDTTSFESCMKSDEIANEVTQDFQAGAQYGSTGTPTFFIGNVDDGFIKLVGAQPYAAFEAAINAQLG